MKRKRKSNIDWRTCPRCGELLTKTSGLMRCARDGYVREQGRAFGAKPDDRPRGWDRIMPTPDPDLLRRPIGESRHPKGRRHQPLRGDQT